MCIFNTTDLESCGYNCGNSRPYPLVILEVPQYNIGRGALVTLTAGGAAVVPTDEIIETYALKPDGTKVYNTSIMAGNQVQINFSEQMTAVDGILQCELQMIDALGHSITTPIFAVRILPSNIDAEAITSSDDFQALVDALAQVQGFDQVKQSIGTLSELTTTAKNNLVAALNELNQNLPNSIYRLSPNAICNSSYSISSLVQDCIAKGTGLYFFKFNSDTSDIPEPISGTGICNIYNAQYYTVILYPFVSGRIYQKRTTGDWTMFSGTTV